MKMKNLMFLALGLVAGFMVSNACGVTFQSVGPTPYGDDTHYATLHPYPATPVSTIDSDPPGQCDWINIGLNAFKTANPNDGSGPSGQAWTFNWAGADAEAKVEAGINILDYFPYVVTVPSVTAGNNVVYPAIGPGELGGAVLNLKYTPQPDAPTIDNLHWIQAYTGTLYGAAVPPLLDNDPANPYKAQSDVSPFYDSVYAAGTLPGGGGWFLDTPLVPENEYELNPVASVEFQVVLASNTVTKVDGVTLNTVTLYGGEWWGFTYSAVEVPEPATLLLLGLGSLILVRRRRG